MLDYEEADDFPSWVGYAFAAIVILVALGFAGQQDYEAEMTGFCASRDKYYDPAEDICTDKEPK